MHTPFLTSLAASVALLTTSKLATAQINVPGAPATVYFTPYRQANCSMSSNLTSLEAPSSYAVTSGHCYNSTYPFDSYAQATNFVPAGTPCEMSIYPEPGCGGQGVGANLTSCMMCYLGPMTVEGQSFQLTCGP